VRICRYDEGNSKEVQTGLSMLVPHSALRFPKGRSMNPARVVAGMFSRIQPSVGVRLLGLALALAGSLGVSLLPRAQATQQVWILPGAAETAGLFGARFSSTLFITNFSSTSASLQIGFIPYSGKPTPAPVTRSIAGGETQQISSVLSSLFVLSSDAGTLIVSSASQLALWMSTVNVANTAGTYGLAIEPLTSEMILSAGSSGNAVWASQTDAFRTNLAVVLLDPNSSVRVTVYNEQGQQRGTTTVSSATPISWQVALPDLIGPSPLVVGRIEISVTQGRAAGYAAVVDNVTNDGIAVMAESVRSDGTDYLLNGVARSPGINNTFWSTDLRLLNLDSSPLQVNLDSLGMGGAAPLVRTVPPSGVIEITDVLGSGGFGFSQAVAGALRVRASNPFLLAARTSNRDLSGSRPGSFSAFQRPARFASGFVVSPAAGVFTAINHTSSVPGYRTNLAFLAGSGGANGLLTLRDRFGVQTATTALSLSPAEWIQKSTAEWFAGFTIPLNARVDLQLSSGSTSGYASRIDNGTGDAVVLPLKPSGVTAVVVSLPQISGCAVFPVDNPWNRDISNDPVDPNSNNYIASMNGATKFLHPDFGSNLTYGIPYVVVSGTQPKVPVTFDYDEDSDPGPYPIPPDAPIEGGAGSTGDRHILVLERDSCLLYETWNSRFVGPGWHCGSGAIFNLRSNQLRPDTWTSADAAGLPILPGLVRYDEAVTDGEISHAVRFTVQSTQRAFIHPATHYASSNTNPNSPPMGLRVRLKASYDLSRFTGASRVILTALKKYGMFVADNGSDWYISGATDARWNDNDLNQMKTVPGSAFEVVQTGTIQR
jgi:hypothetical protein